LIGTVPATIEAPDEASIPHPCRHQHAPLTLAEAESRQALQALAVSPS